MLAAAAPIADAVYASPVVGSDGTTARVGGKNWWRWCCFGRRTVSHGAVRQMCLAHLLRDVTYAIDEGDEGFALGFRFLLSRAVAIGRRCDALKDSALAQCHGDLKRRLDPLLTGAMLDKPDARRLFRVAPGSRRPAPLHHPARRALHQRRLRASPGWPTRDGGGGTLKNSLRRFCEYRSLRH